MPIRRRPALLLALAATAACASPADRLVGTWRAAAGDERARAEFTRDTMRVRLGSLSIASPYRVTSDSTLGFQMPFMPGLELEATFRVTADSLHLCIESPAGDPCGSLVRAE